MKNKALENIFLRRSLLEDVEIFDFIIDEDKYLRLTMINDLVQKKVSIRTNMMEFSKPPLFEFESVDDKLSDFLDQMEFIFNNLIVSDYEGIGSDFDVEVDVIDVKKLTDDLALAQEQLDIFIRNNEKLSNYDAMLDDYNDNRELFNEFEEFNSEYFQYIKLLDEIFLTKNIYDQLVQEDESPLLS